jgi:hypothetical protein
LVLDAIPTPGTIGAGAALSALKNIRNISKNSAGFFSEYLAVVLKEAIDKYAKRGLSPKEAATKAWEEVSGKLSGMAELFTEGGTQLIKNTDGLMGALKRVCAKPNVFTTMAASDCGINDVKALLELTKDRVWQFTRLWDGRSIDKKEYFEFLTRVTGGPRGEGYVPGAETLYRDLENAVLSEKGATDVLNGTYAHVISVDLAKKSGLNPKGVELKGSKIADNLIYQPDSVFTTSTGQLVIGQVKASPELSLDSQIRRLIEHNSEIAAKTAKELNLEPPTAPALGRIDVYGYEPSQPDRFLNTLKADRKGEVTQALCERAAAAGIFIYGNYVDNGRSVAVKIDCARLAAAP